MQNRRMSDDRHPCDRPSAIGRTARNAVVLAGLIWAGAAGALAGDLVVLESDMFGLAPGDIVNGDQAMDVPADKSLVLMTETGQMITLNGPYSGVPDQGGPGEDKLVKAIANLILSEGSDTSSLGAVRDIGAADAKDPWLLDVTQPGEYCFTSETDVQMWRKDPDLFSRIRISDGSKAARTKWPDSEATFGWPPPIPLVDGKLYQFTLDDGEPVLIRLHKMPETLTEPGAKAVWMAEQGCRRQAVLYLVDSME